MTEQLITRQTALLAKEKGFDLEEPCDCGGYPECICDVVRAKAEAEQGYIYRPTQALLQQWLREKYKLFIVINIFKVLASNTTSYKYTWDIMSLNNPEKDNWSDESLLGFLSYEEALEVALQEALKKITI